MAPLDQKDIEFGRSKAGNTFFSKKVIPVGGSVTVKVVDVEKNTTTKYPMTGETFCYRFILEDGQVWDESAASTSGAIIRFMHKSGKMQPVTVKISKLVSKPAKGSQYMVTEVKE